MKNAMLILTFIATASVGIPVRAATAVMTNRKIQEMLSGGIPLPFIIRSIRTAKQIDLYINDREYLRFLNAGASKTEADAIVTAINAREWDGVDNTPDESMVRQSTAPAPKLPAAAAKPATVPATAIVQTPVSPSLQMASARQMVLRDGTPVQLRLTRDLSSADATIKEKVDFEVEEDVKIDDQVVIPRGGLAWGNIIGAEPRTIVDGAGKLEVKVDSVRLADGEKAALRGDKDADDVSHPALVRAEEAAASGIRRPAAALLLLLHSKDMTIPEGREVTAYIDGNVTLEASKFVSQERAPDSVEK